MIGTATSGPFIRTVKGQRTAAYEVGVVAALMI